ncbi:MAG: rhomboid family intramembrane serine protease [Acidobacteria bacterium]|nr:MAG: rhomboid family intramembrane serine protease [Acidobacteriota bacterium]
MFPLRDVIPSRTTPFVTFSLIIANGLVFLYQLTLTSGQLNAFVAATGIVPAETGWLSVRLLSSMFVHAGPSHLISNMLFLWIFGDNVEDRFGHGRYLTFYLLAGMAAGVAQALAVPNALVPIIGASGAIAAVMGAYFVLFPKSRVVMLIWLVFYIDFVEIPAVLFLGFWFLFQFLGGIGSAASAVSGGIAFFAHLGGFVTGAALGRVLARPERADVSWWDPPKPPSDL